MYYAIDDMPQPAYRAAEKQATERILAAIRQRDAEAQEARDTHYLDRKLGSKGFCRNTSAYADAHGFIGRARRIETRHTPVRERHMFSGGDVAHIVCLAVNEREDDRHFVAWCGAWVGRDQRWSRLRAYATCHACIAKSREIDSSEVGWENKHQDAKFGR